MYPILKYPGAKWRLAEWILSHMPPHESYLEPYAGTTAEYAVRRVECLWVNGAVGQIRWSGWSTLSNSVETHICI